MAYVGELSPCVSSLASRIVRSERWLYSSSVGNLTVAASEFLRVRVGAGCFAKGDLCQAGSFFRVQARMTCGSTRTDGQTVGRHMRARGMSVRESGRTQFDRSGIGVSAAPDKMVGRTTVEALAIFLPAPALVAQVHRVFCGRRSGGRVRRGASTRTSSPRGHVGKLDWSSGVFLALGLALMLPVTAI